MTMTTTRSLLTPGLLISGLSLCFDVHAAGFQLVDHSAAGLGRAYAGDAAFSDTAAAVGRNPALATDFERAQFSSGVTYINPEVDTEGEVLSFGSTTTVDASKKDFADSAWVPNAYWVQPINEQWAWGFALNTHFGLSTEYGGDYAASDIADQAEVISYNINPSIAYAYSDAVSVGLGISLVKAEALFGLSFPANDAQLIKVEGDDWGYGWNLGAKWQVSEALRLGINYRSEVELVLDGKAKSAVAPSVLAGSGSVDLTLPAGAEASVVYELNPEWTLSASYQWTDWSVFEQLVLDYDARDPRVLKEEHFEDNERYALALTYQVSPRLTWRAGLALDEAAATAEYRSLSIPDSDRHWYSTGLTYQWSEDLSMDAAVTLLTGDEEPVTERSSLGSRFTGSSKGDAELVALSVNYSF